jgi:hypothetical protein
VSLLPIEEPIASVLMAIRVGAVMLYPDKPHMVRKRTEELWGRACRQEYREAVTENRVVPASSLDDLRKKAAKGAVSNSRKPITPRGNATASLSAISSSTS